MSPMGFAVLRQVYADDVDFDSEYYAATDDQEKQPTKPVPIWLCVFLVVSYIFGGAYLFNKWEKWPFLDAAYFCFITLTTIGSSPSYIRREKPCQLTDVISSYPPRRRRSFAGRNFARISPSRRFVPGKLRGQNFSYFFMPRN